MSKASEWAKRDNARMVALEEARARIDAEMETDAPGIPKAFVRDHNALASVGQYDGHPRMHLTNYAGGAVVLTTVEALALAGWIIDAFGDHP